MVFGKFDEEAMQVVSLAQAEMRGLGHNSVCAEGLLAGVLAWREKGNRLSGEAEATLDGVTLADFRAKMASTMGRGSGHIEVEIPFTQSAKNVLAAADEDYKRINVDALVHTIFKCAGGGGKRRL